LIEEIVFKLIAEGLDRSRKNVISPIRKQEAMNYCLKLVTWTAGS